jgi:hypothetical protein
MKKKLYLFFVLLYGFCLGIAYGEENTKAMRSAIEPRIRGLAEILRGIPKALLNDEHLARVMSLTLSDGLDATFAGLVLEKRLTAKPAIYDYLESYQKEAACVGTYRRFCLILNYPDAEAQRIEAENVWKHLLYVIPQLQSTMTLFIHHKGQLPEIAAMLAMEMEWNGKQGLDTAGNRRPYVFSTATRPAAQINQETVKKVCWSGNFEEGFKWDGSSHEPKYAAANGGEHTLTFVSDTEYIQLYKRPGAYDGHANNVIHSEGTWYVRDLNDSNYVFVAKTDADAETLEVPFCSIDKDTAITVGIHLKWHFYDRGARSLLNVAMSLTAGD